MTISKGLLLLSLLIGLCFFIDAGPASPYPFRLEQADGSQTLDLYLHGASPDLCFMTDADGYTVIQDEASSNYVYAILNTTSGELVSSGILAGTPNAVLDGIPKRITPFAFQGRSNRDLLDGLEDSGDELDTTPRRFLKLPPRRLNLVVLVRFSDHKTRKLPSVSDFDTVFNRPNSNGALAPTGSVRDLFLINSYGQFTLDSTVYGWVDLPQTEAYYAAGRSGFGTTQYFEAFRSAMNALKNDFDVNFDAFDANGDGKVDMVTLIHSGYAAEIEGIDSNRASAVNRIWSHRWRLPQSQIWRGDGIVADEYSTSPALFGLSGSSIGRIGVIAHEIGHTFGLPDLYGTSAGNGIGSFDLMSNHWGFPPYHLSQLYPPIMSPWCKILAGWLDPIVINKSGTYSIAASYTSKQIYRIDLNTAGTEYMLIENRQPIGFDFYLPRGGLAIWHIDDGAASNVEGFPGQAGAWPFNGKHYQVALMQADGKYDLERGTNLGDDGDCFPHNGTDSLDPSVNLLNGPFPNTDAYQGGFVRDTGIRIRDISQSNPVMSFSVDFMRKLSTPFLGGNGASGCMFDLKPKKDVNIRMLYLHTAQAGPAVVELWTKTGTHVSFERNPTSWRRRVVASVNGQGMGLRTLFDVGSIPLLADTVYSFYILVSNGKFRYTNGGATGSITANNDDLTIYEGTGIVGPFGTAHRHRIWNGDVFYEVTSSSPRRLETTFEGGTGQNGVMFEVLPHQNLVVTGFDLHVFGVDAVDIQIYTKDGTFAGSEKQCEDWHLVAAVTVVGRGMDAVTTVTLPQDSSVPLKTDQLQAFYITVSNGRGLRYSPGHGTGSPVVSNEHLSIFEGVGVEYPCGSTFWDRVWNGALHYEVVA